MFASDYTVFAKKWYIMKNSLSFEDIKLYNNNKSNKEKSGKIMNKTEVKETFYREALIPVVRGNNYAEAKAIIEGCKEAGFGIIEMTYTNPDADQIIKDYINDDAILIGAGSIINLARAKSAIASGAKFVVAPNINLTVAKYCDEHNILYVPGCFTATEVALALENDIDFVKIFPGDAVSYNYLKALNGPLPEMNFMVTGGVDNENYKTWLDAGAKCVGLGSSLTKDPTKIVEVGKRLFEGI